CRCSPFGRRPIGWPGEASLTEGTAARPAAVPLGATLARIEASAPAAAAGTSPSSRSRAVAVATTHAPAVAWRTDQCAVIVGREHLRRIADALRAEVAHKGAQMPT